MHLALTDLQIAVRHVTLHAKEQECPGILLYYHNVYSDSLACQKSTSLYSSRRMVHTPQQRRQFGTKTIMARAVQQIGRRKKKQSTWTDRQDTSWAMELRHQSALKCTGNGQPTKPTGGLLTSICMCLYFPLFLRRIVLTSIQQNLI